VDPVTKGDKIPTKGDKKAECLKSRKSNLELVQCPKSKKSKAHDDIKTKLDKYLKASLINYTHYQTLMT
jgi:hypothetical protein